MLTASEGDPPTDGAIAEALRPYWEEHKRIATDGVARAPTHSRLTRNDEGVLVQVTLIDEEETEWSVDLFAPLERSRKEVALEFVRIGPPQM